MSISYDFKTKTKNAFFMAVLLLLCCFFIVWQVRLNEQLYFHSDTMYCGSETTFISDGDNYSQSFAVGNTRFQGIYLMVDGFGDGTVTERLIDSDGNIAVENTAALSECVNAVRHTLLLDEAVNCSPDTVYTLDISCVSEDGGIYVNTENGELAAPFTIIYEAVEIDKLTIALVGIMTACFAVLCIINLLKIPDETKFIVFFIICGIVFSVGITLVAGPDEGNHYYRILEISQGRFISALVPTVPSGVLPDYYRSFFAPIRYNLLHINDVIDFDNQYVAAYQNTSVYSPVCYLPQALFAFIARQISDNRIFILYMIRLGNLISTALLLHYAVKTIPVGKYIMMLVSLLPPIIQSCCTASADGITFSVCCAFTALFLKVYLQPGVMTKKQIFGLYALSVLLCQCKLVYCVPCLLLFFIPKNKFISGKSRLKHILYLGTILVITAFGWLAIASRYLAIPMYDGIDTAAQIDFIIHNPIKFVWNIAKTATNVVTHVEQMLGSWLGWYTIAIPSSVVYIYFLLLIAVVMFDSTISEKLKPITSFVMIFTGLLNILMVYVAEYIQYTIPGNDLVSGIQGRYFLPCICLLLIPISSQLRKYTKPFPASFNFIFAAAVITVCSGAIIISQTY